MHACIHLIQIIFHKINDYFKCQSNNWNKTPKFNYKHFPL